MLNELITKVVHSSKRYRFGAAAIAVCLGLFAFAVSADLFMTLSPQQKAQSELGNNAVRVDVPVYTRAGVIEQTLPQLDSPERGFTAQLETYDLYIDSDPSTSLVYKESHWEEQAPDFGLALVQGHWPSAPGEVVVTEDVNLSLGENTTAFNGTLPLRIVGVASNSFHKHEEAVYGASGTWNTIDADAYSMTSASVRPIVFGSEGKTPAALTEFIRSQIGDADLVDRAALDDAFSASLLTRESLLATPPSGFADSYSFFFGLFAVVIPCALIFFLWRITYQVLRPLSQRFFELGISPFLLWKSSTSTLLRSALMYSVLGLVVGAGLAQCVRPFISGIAGLPDPGVLIPWKWLVLLLASSLAALLIGGVATAPSTQPHPFWKDIPLPAPSASFLRWSAIAIVLVAALFTVASALLGPDVFETWAPLPTVALCIVFSLLLAQCPRTSRPYTPAGVALRFAEKHRQLIGTGLTLLVLCMGTAVFSSSMSASFTASENDSLTSTIAPNQAHVLEKTDDGLATNADSIQHVANALGVPAPVRVSYVQATLDMPTEMSGTFGVLSIESVHDVERLLDRELTASEKDVLATGALVRDNRFIDHDHASISTSRNPSPTTLPAVSIDFGPHWEKLAGGIILESTAQKLNAPARGAQWVFTELNEEAEKRFLDSAAQARIPHELVLLPLVQSSSTPRAFYISLAAALLSALAVTFVFSRHLARATEAIETTFKVLGLDSSWHLRIVVLTTATLACTAIITGCIAGILPLAGMVYAMGDGLTFAIDWKALLVAAGAIALGAASGVGMTCFRYVQRPSSSAAAN
ncbi:hypothetical protein [Corynebacterium striatum]|uniref:hypothetical protein n=1 Tax=Corynebacterium striatum TaxID=43770 RepID=UPI00254E4C29|nr:hypothetical protein [Corynebacterium striatum]MDK7884129.1 hypothetical protein [Corynebacterium striatum]